MAAQPACNAARNEASIYAIRLDGHLNALWTEWFDGMHIALLPDGTTLLCGRMTDQAALHGLLRTIRDLGLPLVSLVRIDPHSHNSTQGDRP